VYIAPHHTIEYHGNLARPWQEAVMLEARWRQRLCEAAEHIVMWASSDGTRCVLAFLEGVLELRLESDGEVMRRAHYIDMRPACDAARQWRTDWDIESRWRRVLNSRTICPECGDEAFREQDADSDIQWLRCASCGDAWLEDTPRMWRH
jgi:hypothetical protein